MEWLTHLVSSVGIDGFGKEAIKWEAYYTAVPTVSHTETSTGSPFHLTSHQHELTMMQRWSYWASGTSFSAHHQQSTLGELGLHRC